MSVTITHADGTIVPTLVDGFESTRVSRTVVHEKLDRSDDDITVRPASLRTGMLSLLFADTSPAPELVVVGGYVQYAATPAQDAEAASKEAEDLHAAGGVFTITAPGRPSVEFSYVPTGAITRHLDDVTRAAWLLEVEFLEVTV